MASGSKLLGSRSASALCFSTSSLPQGPGSLQEFPPSDPHSKEKARRTKERQEGPKAAVFPLLSFSEVLLPPKSCLRLTGQKLVQRPYPGAVELGTGISKLGTPLLHLKIKSTSYECKQRM